MDDNSRLEKKDKEYIWHPFTQMRDWELERPVIISEGKGSIIYDVNGKGYLDGVSSLWVNIHGHRKREINLAMKKQLDRISHSTLLGLSNVPAIKLAERLMKIIQQSFYGRGNPMWLPSSGQACLPDRQAHRPAPTGPQPSRGSSRLSKVFYSDNGSTSVEVALKMAFQYWKHRGAGGKHSFLALGNAYHGDTIGAVSVGGIDIFHKAFAPLLFKTFRAPSPYCYRCGLGAGYRGCGLACVNKMEEVLKVNHSEIAAVILEPLVQAAGGMIVSPPGYLKGVRELCSKYNVLMIADEVATGFGRTGRMFACEHESVAPDLLCLSKGITGGYLPLAATIATDEIYNAFLGEFKDIKTFFHGHSYTGNPLACAAALACLDIFEKENTIAALAPKIEVLEKWLSSISVLPHVGNVRSKGLMAGVELVKDKGTKEPYPWEEKMGWKVAHLAAENGVFIRPLGNIIVIMPPLSISLRELRRLLKVIKSAVLSVT